VLKEFNLSSLLKYTPVRTGLAKHLRACLETGHQGGSHSRATAARVKVLCLVLVISDNV
jgi:hypothetical protein